ncbi:MAG: class I SAM-dependent DNA methyltransferase [Phycisphaerae bacterium]|nr:class I SAM-dependent DNA methyltransferase [Phycisphaerae bacterium]
MAQPSTPAEFVAKWSEIKLSERAASQEHFLDLCRLLGQPTPAEHDATGAEYTFEKGVAPAGGASRGSAGERGFADVWWRGKFAWEYKRRGKYRDLKDAYRQLCQYREALENPPLLIVSDIERTEIHTNFTGTVKQVHEIALADLDKPESLDLLRRIFTDPASFKPTVTPESVTRDIATQFSTIAKSLRQFGHDAHTVAHFLMKCMFCLFAEDVELLPKDLFGNLIRRYQKDPAKLTDRLTELFATMRTGGDFGAEPIDFFNGGLFDDSAALRLTSHDIAKLLIASQSDWGSVEPAIFGTLFERSLDPNTRAQIGAHYTSRDDIMLVVEPVIMAPLRREWEAVKEGINAQLKRRRKGKADAKRRADKAIADALHAFVQRLATIRILDPACGSGNFLYVAIQQLLDLEKEVTTFAARPDIALSLLPQVRPTQLHGIEINPYAAELAQVVIWIGYLQWMRDNGFNVPRNPILEPLQSIECRDAILDRSDAENPKPAVWPEAEFIIGNPPFLGSRKARLELTDSYVDLLQRVYRDQLPEGADLCCYWFEKSREFVEEWDGLRCGLLATQGIRGGSNRHVLDRIKQSGEIFLAWSDLEWALDGAMVHISIIGFDSGNESVRTLDGVSVTIINADLSAGVDLTVAGRLAENEGVSFQGTINSGEFDVSYHDALSMLRDPNPTVHRNDEVIRPWVNGTDITRRNRGRWIIDFGVGRSETEASAFHAPFEKAAGSIRTMRDELKDGKPKYAHSSVYPFWQLWCPRPEMRAALADRLRYVATPRVTKHRLFVWLSPAVLSDAQLIAFARSDDYFFGLLQSSIHELWARRRGTQLREAESGFRYTPTTCFETFPLPWPPGKEHENDEAYSRIAEAAKELDEHRERWLNPPEWIDPIAARADAQDDFRDVPEQARELIRHSAIMARAAKDPKLKKRTLTNLYNQRPTWLKLAHEKLDRAVIAAYAKTDPGGNWQEDWAEVWAETGAGSPLPAGHALAVRRKEIDQLVLGNLLRMNLERSK